MKINKENTAKRHNFSGKKQENNGCDKRSVISENERTIGSFGEVVTGSEGEIIRCISIIGQIEGHSILPETQKTTKYEHILPLLVSIEEDSSSDGLLVLLNTVGGDVEAGLAIAEMIASMKKPSVSLVLGGGHSIGVPLAVCTKKSFIVPSATMTVHPVRINGTFIGAPQTYCYLEKVQKRINSFITSHSGISEERLRELLMKTDEIAADIGSVIEGSQAVDEGIISSVGGLSDALASLRGMIKAEKADNSAGRREKQSGAL